jgi:hypothetical protein
MLRHLEASRMSADLEIGMEVRILLQYTWLKLHCGLLLVLIRLLGLQRLAGPTWYPERFTQRLGEGLAEFKLAAHLGEPDGAGAL